LADAKKINAPAQTGQSRRWGETMGHGGVIINVKQKKKTMLKGKERLAWGEKKKAVYDLDEMRNGTRSRKLVPPGRRQPRMTAS